MTTLSMISINRCPKGQGRYSRQLESIRSIRRTIA